jgi:hypothetical protein
MFNQKMHGRGLVLIPFLLALLLLTFMFIVITPSKANQLADIPDRTVQPTTNNHWLTECVDCGKRFSSLTNQSTKLDVGGNPHIVYGGDHLYYTWFDGTKWNYETIDDSPLVGGSAALALDQSGNPHVSYHDRFNHALKYAYHDVYGWHSMIVDQNPGDTGVLTSIALDQSDLPHITYYDVADHMLRYAYFNGTDWQINNIDKGGVYSNIVLDSSGSPHISYESIDHGYLNYAYIGGSGWVTETLDTGDTSSFTSIVLDDSGYPHIGYYDNQSGSLKYAFQDAGEIGRAHV